MMPMAYAAEMPHDMQMAEIEMAHASMSEMDCEHCPKKIEENEEPEDAMDCADGHCFMHSAPVVPDSQQTPNPLIAVYTVDTLPLSLYVPVDLSTKPHSTAPPGLVIYTKTIVLRF